MNQVMESESKVITAHIPLDLAERVDAASARLERSRGWIMKQALEDWLVKQQPKGFAEASMPFTYANHNTAQVAAAQAVAALKALRETTTLGPIPWQELRDAGRK